MKTKNVVELIGFLGRDPARATASDGSFLHARFSVATTDPWNGEQQSQLAAGGASEPPLPAEPRAPLRLAAPFVTHLVPTPRSPTHRRSAAEELGRIPASLSCRGERI